MAGSLSRSFEGDDDSSKKYRIRRPFPVDTLVPREETQALDFVRDHPEWDGRGVTIGILDTGIDPAVHGGEKLVDTVDCSGSGDVDVSVETVAEWWCDGERKCCWRVTGLTGRTLELSADWKILPFPEKKENDKTKKKSSKQEDKEGASSTKDDSADDDDAKTKKEEEGGEKKKKKTVPVRLGVKAAYELYPGRLVARIKRERKNRMERNLAPHVSSVRARLASMGGEQQQGKAPTPEKAREREDWNARLELLADNGGTWLEDDPGPLLDCVVFFDGHDYRAVVYGREDDEGGNNVVDLTASTCGPMTDYRKERQYASLGTSEQCNFAVNLYQEGKVLSIVTESTPHGTHVSGIAAYCASNEESGEEDEEERDAVVVVPNGVAPGARLVSLKIGDNRLGSMETTKALGRAMVAAVRTECDLINMSYGESTAVPDAGKFVELARELVYKHNVAFVAAASNDGPALSTVMAPGSTTSAVLAVSARVDADMLRTTYSLPIATDGGNSGGGDTAQEEQQAQPTYTWSGAGPAPDGDFGIGVMAPGGAITAVSQWTLQKSMLMHGTSMSSPNGAGCLALVQSAYKATTMTASEASGLLEKQPPLLTPARLRRAVENTARPMPSIATTAATTMSSCEQRQPLEQQHEEPLQQGYGMIQVRDAWEYLRAHRDCPAEDVTFAVEVENRPGRPRGIYLREPEETVARRTFSILVNPQFPRQDSPSPNLQAQKLELQMQLNVTTTSPSWVTVPDHFLLLNNGRSFKIHVDPTKLEPGVHTATVSGSDVQRREGSGGPMFTLPITVIKCLPVLREHFAPDLAFAPAQVRRFFVVPPPGSTWMNVTITDGRRHGQGADVEDANHNQDLSACGVVLHCLQVLPHVSIRDTAKQKHLFLLPGQASATTVAVEDGVTCEVAVARNWSTLVNPTKLDVRIDFGGIRPVPRELHLQCGVGAARVRIHSDLDDETINPAAKLTKWMTPLRPKNNAVVAPLQDERDLLFPRTKTNKAGGETEEADADADADDENANDPRTSVYELVLQYEFAQEEKGSIVPKCPTLQDELYESPLRGQLMMVFDGDKKYLGKCDAFAGSVTVPKGNITVRLQLCHEDPSQLEKFTDLVLWIQRDLEKSISLSAYTSKQAAVTAGADKANGGGALKKRTMRKGSSMAVFFAEPSASKLPSSAKAGDVLLGTVTYGAGNSDSSSSKPGEGKRPGGFPLSYAVGPKPEKPPSSEPETPEAKDERTVEEKVSEAVRDVKVGQLGKLTPDEIREGKFDELYQKCIQEYPDHLPVYVAMLKHLTSCEEQQEQEQDGNNKKEEEQSSGTGGAEKQQKQERQWERLEKVVAAADNVVGRISQDELAMHFGKKVDSSDPQAAKERKLMKEKKGFLMDALARKAMAYADMSASGRDGGDGDDETTASPSSLFDDTLKQLKEWTDLDSDNNKYAALVMERDLRAGHYGLVIKLINKLLSKDAIKDAIKPMTKSELYEKRAQILRQRLGYKELAECDQRIRVMACPKSYAPF